jgi:hypothetical protein
VIRAEAIEEVAYEGLKSPALARYGETTNREDEVV